MAQFVCEAKLRQPEDRVFIVHLQTDIQSALALLRLADAECRTGQHSRATELIDRAILAYKAAMTHLDRLSGNTEETAELRIGARELFEAIHLAEFRCATTQG